jgi:CSLREA domain-containing protein
MPRALVRAALIATAALAGSAVPAGAASIEVTVINDELNADQDCSLREAVQAANTNSAVSGCPKGQASKRDTIRLLPGEIHQLGPTAGDEDLNASGDLDLRPDGGPLTMKGNARGMGGPLIAAATTSRAIESVSGSSALTLEKLNLQGGDVTGTNDTLGGVVSMQDARLTFRDVNVEGGTATRGGGVRMEGANLKIIDSFIGSNGATFAGGGVSVVEANLLKLARSGVGGNDVAGDDVTGAGVVSAAERTQVIDSELQFNTLETTTSDGVANGGGISSSSERLEIRRSLILGNAAQDVGGSSNSFGGGVDSAGLGTRVDVVNSTLFGNDAEGTGGALRVAKGTVSNATFASNTATDGGDHMTVAGPGPLKIRNSIIPATLGFTDPCFGPPGSFVSKGYSVIQFDDPTCAFLDSDALVAEVGFADGTPLPNGGETFTMGIEKSSPARNLIPKRKCKVAQREDQRDFKRPAGKKCDAGAFERGAKP